MKTGSHPQEVRFLETYRNTTIYSQTHSSHSITIILKDYSASKFAIPSIRSEQISCSVVSDSPRPHELQHARPPCPSPTPGVH